MLEQALGRVGIRLDVNPAFDPVRSAEAPQLDPGHASAV
jgi:hypothetical protein